MNEQIMDSGATFLSRDGWVHCDKWKRQGKNFMVEVSRHSRPEFNRDYSKVIGENHFWCVYLYVYPGHPDFSRFNTDGDMWSQPFYECHSYVSLFNIHRGNDGKITSFQLGWDYQHDGDSEFSEYGTTSSAYRVFYDASHLFDEAMSRINEVQS